MIITDASRIGAHILSRWRQSRNRDRGLESYVDARIDVLGLQIDCVDMEGAVRRAAGFIDSGKHAHLVLAVNPEKVIAAREQPALADFLRESDLSIPDGIGVVVAARMLGGDRKSTRLNS